METVSQMEILNNKEVGVLNPCRRARGMARWRRWFLRILVFSPFVLGAAHAQPVITSGPNYCCLTIGPNQQALTASGGTGPYTWVFNQRVAATGDVHPDRSAGQFPRCGQRGIDRRGHHTRRL